MQTPKATPAAKQPKPAPAPAAGEPAAVKPHKATKEERSLAGNTSHKQKSKLPLIIALVACALAVTGGIIAAVMLFGGRMKNSGNWTFGEYDAKYPFYAVEYELDENGDPTGKTRINRDVTKYSEDRMRMYLVITPEGELRHVLYVDGAPEGYTEPVESFGKEEWVIDSVDPHTFEELAHLYRDGSPTDVTTATGVVFEPERYVRYYFGTVNRVAYINGAMLEGSETPFEGYGETDWVIDGRTYVPGTFEELARLYVNGIPAEASSEPWYDDVSAYRRTGIVYRYYDYVFYDEAKQTYYRLRYVNGVPTEERTDIDGLGYEEWVVEYRDPATGTVTHHYNTENNEQIAYLYIDGKIQPTTWKATGVDTVIENWVREETDEAIIERKYVNGLRTEETRVVKLKPKQEKQQTPAYVEPQPVETQQPEPQTPAEPAFDDRVAKKETVEIGAWQYRIIYRNAAGEVVYSEEKILDEANKQYVITKYDRFGNYVSSSTKRVTITYDETTTPRSIISVK